MRIKPRVRSETKPRCVRLVGHFRYKDGNGNDNLQINDLIGWMRKNNRAARAARFYVQFFYVAYQKTSWNFQFWGFDDNTSPQQQIFHS